MVGGNGQESITLHSRLDLGDIIFTLPNSVSVLVAIFGFFSSVGVAVTAGESLWVLTTVERYCQ